MGRSAEWLSVKQIETLEWIKGDCPEGEPELEVGRRIVARSLHRRGLVKIKGRGDSWTASITEAGLAWQASHSEARVEEAQIDDLIRRVVAAGGRVELSGGPGREATHKELVRRGNYSPNRPMGWRLELKTTGRWDNLRREVILVRHFEDLVDLVPVLVPDRVARYHPTVKAFLADRDWQFVSKDHLGRAARILQAIAEEAQRRGYAALSASQAKGLPPHASDARSHDRGWLALRTPGGVYDISVKELSGPSRERLMPRRWDQRRTRAAWLDARNTEFVSTGNLELVVTGPGVWSDGDRYRDTKTITVEDRLPRLFQSIEVYRLEAELREQERERESSVRRSRWEAAMAEARTRYADQVRWDAFERRSRDWREVTRHREFLAAAKDSVSRYEGPEREGLVTQLGFAERRLDEIDPIRHPRLLLPLVPEAKPDDLKAYLDGWSPHGPDSSAW
jgi:hypothetical protein